MKIQEIRFLRNTHDKFGNYRQECDDIKIPLCGLGVHALESSRAITFAEFAEEHRKYSQDNPETPCPSVPALLEDLAAMLRVGLAVVQKEVLFTETHDFVPDEQIAAD